VAAAAAATASLDEADADAPRTRSEVLYIGALFVAWYAFSIGFNIYNKQVLKVFPYAMFCTNVHLAVGAGFAGLMYLTRSRKFPSVPSELLWRIAPLALVHTVGNVLTNISLGKVAVSFTHTVKSMEPFFSVIFSAIFLGDIPSLTLVLSLLPVVGGVVLASFTEASFNWAGLAAAMGSNLTFTSRNVLSKKVSMCSVGG